MKTVLMLVVASACCYVSSATQVYYITPNQGNCSVGKKTLKPCYTLSQLIVDDVLSSSKDHSVELAFLSGIHLISASQTLVVSNFSEVVVRPFIRDMEVVIQCHSKNVSNLAFQDVANVSLLVLHFNSCSLYHDYKTIEGFMNVILSKCVFEGSKNDNASVSITNRERPNLNASVHNCTFFSNKRAVYIFGGISAFTHVQITDTLIQKTVAENDTDFYSPVKASSITISHAVLTISNSQFLDNVAGLGIMSIEESSFVLADSKFLNNSVSNVGGILRLYYSTSNISHCQFVNNSGGTAISMYRSHDERNCYIFFSNFYGNVNSGYEGGALNVQVSLSIFDCDFRNNSAWYGGALYLKGHSEVYRIGNSNFSFNVAKQDGGAIFCENVKTVYLSSYGNASSNYASRNGGFAYLSNCEVDMDAYFILNNEALNGGAVYATTSQLKFSHPFSTIAEILVRGNYAASNGGAFYFVNSNFVATHSRFSLLFVNNTAANKGGGIFCLDQVCENTRCFIPMDATFHHVRLTFVNNTASHGPVLFGGLLDRCLAQSAIPRIRDNVSIHFDPTPLAITSEAVRVCLCTDDLQVNCSTREITLQAMKGQSINILGALVDQDSNPVQSFVKADYSELSTKFGKGESRMEVGSRCSNLSYHVFTANTSAKLILRPEGVCEHVHFSTLAVNIVVWPCPTGFESDDGGCGCDKRLVNFSMVCNIDTYSLQRQRPVWVRYDQSYLKVHANCPLDYCNASQDNISFEFPDKQCANHRSGVLCGACQDNYSIALGGSKCLQCTSNYTVIWLIPVFALAGIALVALLFVCNMTISHGTLNGLIFYANVVSIAGLTCLQNCSIYPILKVFIAWINLDLGVETCLYSGMDTYQKTWLQFAFPLYIWLLVGAVILASQCSTTAVKLFGRSSIAVLATLFLLSYSKILKTIITALNFTEVFQGSANDTSDTLVPYNVWAYDGNLEYLKGKHVPLFAVAMVFLVVLFLPYTLLLMFGQCLRSLPTERRYVPRCIRSTAFISIMDAYHAPYNKRHRYWTGLLLLTRCVLYLAFATSYTDDQLLSNMYITTLILSVMLALNILRVYENFVQNFLEVGFLLNLAILSGTLYYIRGNSSSSKSVCKCTSSSISVSMVLFAGVLVYHAYLQLRKTKCFESFQNRFLTKCHIQQCFAEGSSSIFQDSTELRRDLVEIDEICN